MSGLFDQKKTTTTKLPAASAEEKALLSQQLQLATAQLKNLSTVGDFTSDVFEKLLPELVGQINKFLPQQQQISGQGMDFASEQIGAQSELLQSELDAIRNGVALTPEQSALIDQSAQSSIDAGLSDISRFRDESLRTLAQETAIGRGLRPEDTPILDVGGQIANESGRQAQQLISQIRAQAAQQKLEYPLAVGSFQAGRTQAQQTLGASTLKLVEDLKQQAFTNRLNLTSTAGGIGLTAAQIGPNASTLAGLQDLRAKQATTTEKVKGNFGDFISAASQLAMGVGGVMSGYKAMGGLGLASGGPGFTSTGGLGLASSDF